MATFNPKKVKLSDSNIEYIQNIKVLKELPDDSAALRTIINEHQEYKKHIFDLNFITHSLKVELKKDLETVISEQLLGELRRVRLGTNNTDRNTQILIELLASWMMLSNIEAIPSTDKMKPDFLKFAETIVHSRITHKKQKKDDKLARQNGENAYATI